jgi:hypothetical protein
VVAATSEDQPITGPEKANRRDDKAMLIGRELRKISDPCAAYAKTEQDQRQDAARRSHKRRKKAARRRQPLTVDR